MSRVRIAYQPRPNATPESETTALAAVYRFVLERHAQKQDADRNVQLDSRKEVPDESLTR
jgi:DNA-binding helix-hairpin-helix protein with protein kinase domain